MEEEGRRKVKLFTKRKNAKEIKNENKNKGQKRIYGLI